MGTHLEALTIYQQVLDVISDALMRDDAKTVAAHLTQPFHMRTAKGWFPLNTFDDVEQMVTSMHLSLKIQGTSDYARTASKAAFLDDGSIEGYHTTNILVHGRALVRPYENRMVLKNEDDIWKVQSADHSMDNAKWPISMPKVSNGTLSEFERETQNDAVALEIYQSFIDTLTKANLSGDHKEWNVNCEFPHRVRIDNVNHTISSKDDTSSFLNTMSDILDKAIDSEFKREASFAGFIADNIIRGYHITTLGGAGNASFRPVQSRITIRRTKGKWRMIELVNSIANTEFPYETPIVSDTLISEFHNPKKAQIQ